MNQIEELKKQAAILSQTIYELDKTSQLQKNFMANFKAKREAKKVRVEKFAAAIGASRQKDLTDDLKAAGFACGFISADKKTTSWGNSKQKPGVHIKITGNTFTATKNGEITHRDQLTDHIKTFLSIK